MPPHLVLRLLPPTYPQNQSTLTGTLHQYLSKQQYPTPNVHIIGNNTTILGGEFLLMDYVQGKTIFTELNEHSPSQIAEACYKLHQIDPQPLIHQYKVKGIPQTRYQGLGWREEYIENNVKWLRPALYWVKEHYPRDRSNIRICHGEFHPLNVIVEDGQICAVLDWSTFKIEDPHYDLASLRNLSYIMIPTYLPERDWRRFFDDFLDAYVRVGGLDRDLFDYYVVFLALMMIVSGLRYSNAVAHPRIQEGLRSAIQEFTGITLKPI